MRLGTLDGNLCETIRQAVLAKLPGADVKVDGQGGHFTIRVVSAEFAGKNPVAKQRLVLGAIAHLMSGPSAPVHAIDRLETLLPNAE